MCRCNNEIQETILGMHSAHTMATTDASSRVSRPYAWLVFALTFGLLLSDYMSRQVLNAVFPLLKTDWGLSDTQLGSLSSIVALMVGLLTFPLSVLADRWGRVKSIVLMAGIWGLATLGCAIATNYGEMFAARFFVGLGEAAYGSVGIAVIISIFPPHLRSTLSGAFMAGGAFGSVVGMGLGGVLAMHFGWRVAFGSMAVMGLVLTVVYRLVVTEKRLGSPEHQKSDSQQKAMRGLRVLLKGLFSTKSVVCAYIGSGLQLFIMGTLFAWLPSFLNRTYGMTADKSGVMAALFVLIAGTGMVMCGIITDRVSQKKPIRKWSMCIAYSLISFSLLSIAFLLPPSPAQLALIGVAMFFAAGTSGPAGAMVANLTSPVVHAAAFATLTLANNLFGLAPGPLVTGMLADRLGLHGALQAIVFIALPASIAFLIGRRHYAQDLLRIQALREEVQNAIESPQEVTP
jgi:MFS family permease